MERLTKWFQRDGMEHPEVFHFGHRYGKAFFPQKHEFDEYVQIVDRLAAIEDILGDEYDLDHLRELVQAEKDGRLVVMPCKVGDTVYTLSHQTMIDEDGNEWYICSPKYKCVIEKQFTLFDLNHIGKTVFLTCEEAEAALKGGDNHA